MGQREAWLDVEVREGVLEEVTLNGDMMHSQKEPAVRGSEGRVLQAGETVRAKVLGRE